MPVASVPLFWRTAATGSVFQYMVGEYSITAIVLNPTYKPDEPELHPVDAQQPLMNAIVLLYLQTSYEGGVYLPVDAQLR